jgi:hypothetical protein
MFAKACLTSTLARLLANLYTTQKMCVEWGDHLSALFNVRNGVKQGGVLSPILFSLYICELVEKLSKTEMGCHMGHIFMGAFAYADDVILLSPTLGALKKTLKVCNAYSVEFKIKFNEAKCKLLIFGLQNVEGIEVVFNNKMKPTIGISNKSRNRS